MQFAITNQYNKSRQPIQTFLSQNLDIREIRSQLKNKKLISRNVYSSLNNTLDSLPIKKKIAISSLRTSLKQLNQSYESNPIEEPTLKQVSFQKEASKMVSNSQWKSIDTQTRYTSNTSMIKQKLQKLKPITITADPFVTGKNKLVLT